MKLPHPLRALRSRNYRLFFAGQLVSLIGSWITIVATSWLVYRLSQSSVELGLVNFVGQIPLVILMPVAGVLVDRWDLKRTLMGTQILSMIQSALLAILVITNVISIPMIFILSAFQGLVNSFDMPARQSFVYSIIEHPSDLSNAIALNSSVFNAARLIGPAIAGIIIAAFGEGICFAIDAVSYLAVIWAFTVMKTPKREVKVSSEHLLADLLTGLRYVTNFPPILAILLLTATIGFAGMPYMVLMPVFAKEILHGNAATLGLLTGSAGLGALLGGILLASRKSVLGLGRVMVVAGVCFSLSLIGFSLSKTIVVSCLFLAIIGFSMINLMASANTIIQTVVDDDKRGRVMSLFALSFMGMIPFGSICTGLIATPDRLGPSTTVTIGAIACLFGIIIFAFTLPKLRGHVRPIYIRRGIIQDLTPNRPDVM